MPVNAQPRRTRPNSAPAYYLGRPASLWITATAAPALPAEVRRPVRFPARPVAHVPVMRPQPADVPT
jgi:hypothetical protein